MGFISDKDFLTDVQYQSKVWENMSKPLTGNLSFYFCDIRGTSGDLDYRLHPVDIGALVSELAMWTSKFRRKNRTSSRLQPFGKQQVWTISSGF